MCYRDTNDQYHVIHATMSDRHSANPSHIQDTEGTINDLEISSVNVTFYYAVHSDCYKNFQTDPAFK